MKNLQEMTDEELALSYVNGNHRAFDLLLSRNQSKLFSYILFVVHDQDTANDVFQETFVKAIAKLHEGRYATTGKFSAWTSIVRREWDASSSRQQTTTCRT